MADETPAQAPGGTGEEKVSVNWVILQRLEDLHARVDQADTALGARLDKLEQALTDLRHEVATLRNWSLGLLLLAILGLLAKLLIPGA
ncbi:conserved protein of unknown function [Candidatus Hydrogenisulfobacillus filiaventi]|uniref:Uncharacterized protein n=1 Tax=Candidatus Hydrogenisulfobacillus filiaventi TaxID=2707344 RepID=A0A6F8ZF83_9FIRM|nr:hypothetical protein [Bacillota bacterium]CAB1128437.1 conserved protein of unknown function [Candidatus Hydrogenisulfobacillus filiaventi]